MFAVFHPLSKPSQSQGQEIFVNGDLKQLVSIPGITPSVRYQTLLVNLASEGPLGRCVMRFREFVSFKGAREEELHSDEHITW